MFSIAHVEWLHYALSALLGKKIINAELTQSLLAGLSVEEFVGQLWHKIITRAASKTYPEAAVRLEHINRRLAIQFRAFGGDIGLQILPSSRSDWHSRRGWLSRIASGDHQVELAWVDGETLRLPSEVAIFPTEQGNHNLYLWLAALAASAEKSATTGSWLQDNQRAVQETLMRFPGLRSIYRQLSAAHLPQRPPLDKVPKELRQDEQLLREAIAQPGSVSASIADASQLTPVPIWLHPCPPQLEVQKVKADDDDDVQPERGKHARELKENRRRKGERVDDVDGKDGLLAFRLESVMSWAEFVPVDRTADDDDEDNAEEVANDLDTISVAKSKEAPASRLKFDLDLPSEKYDDVVVKGGILLPEWDYRKATLKKDFCSLTEMESSKLGSGELPDHLRQQARRLRAHFENLAMGKQWLRGQPEGSELDIDRFVIRQADVKHGHLSEEPGLFKELRQNVRDLSCLLLADLSLSTDAWVNNEARVIDVVRDSLYLFAEALSGVRDRFSIAGFSSKRRDHIRYYQLKGFDEPLNSQVRKKLAAVEPGYYTRMGAAIRHAVNQLLKEQSSNRLLLLVTDGKPNDIDLYEGRYGVEDTRQAIREAFVNGIRVFCITIDEEANDYLPHIFGTQNYTVINRAAELPQKLPLLYAQLTR